MTEAERIRILIADDHAVVREGLRAVIQSRPDMQVIGEAADGAAAVDRARELQPDVILMDLLMPRKSGVEAIGDIIRENSRARILVLTSFSDDDQAFPAIRAGALGYVLKRLPAGGVGAGDTGCASGRAVAAPDDRAS